MSNKIKWATIWDRFFSKVKIGTITRSNVTTPCFEWQAGATHGRAVIAYKGIGEAKALPWYASRVIWELTTGKAIPEDKIICHHCDNGMCVRPDHLFLGTTQDNITDAVSKGHMGKLTPEQVREIREIYGTNKGRGNYLSRINMPTELQLAEKYGVSQETISYIVNNKIFKTVK